MEDSIIEQFPSEIWVCKILEYLNSSATLPTKASLRPIIYLSSLNSRWQYLVQIYCQKYFSEILLKNFPLYYLRDKNPYIQLVNIASDKVKYFGQLTKYHF